MSIGALTRRAALADLGAGALLFAAAVRPALAQPAVRFRAIEVDVAPLRASAGDPTADWVEQELPRDLAQALAAHVSPGDRNGATLVARIRYVYLGPSGGGAGPSGASQDSIQGVLIVRGPRGGMAAETPLRAIATYYPMGVDQALVEEAYHGRVVALAQAFAGWAPRELGL
jgi:hypothetical protein